jgi:general secretion pathway protein F
MPAYSYEAVDTEGRPSRGMVEADTARSARSQLRSRGLVALSVQVVESGSASQAKPGLLQRQLWTPRAFNALKLAIHTRQLAGLVRAGLPLERALTVLAEEAEDERQQAVLSALRAEVNAGASYGKSLAQFPEEFDATYRAVIAAGEQGDAALRWAHRRG